MNYSTRFMFCLYMLVAIPSLSFASQDEKLASGTVERISIRYFQIYMKYDSQPFSMGKDMEVKAQGAFKNKRIPLLKDMTVTLSGDRKTREVFHVVVHGPYSILKDVDKQ